MPKLARTLTDVSVRNFKPKDKPYKVPVLKNAGRGVFGAVVRGVYTERLSTVIWIERPNQWTGSIIGYRQKDELLRLDYHSIMAIFQKFRHF